MGIKIRTSYYKNEQKIRIRHHYFCVGCNEVHGIDPEVHKYNSDPIQPTFTPSLLLEYNTEGKQYKCHSYITAGVIEFLNDCTHAHAGEKFELQDVEVWDPHAEYGGEK